MLRVHLQVAGVGWLVGLMELAIFPEQRFDWRRQRQSERGLDEPVQKDDGERSRLRLGPRSVCGLLLAEDAAKGEHGLVERPWLTADVAARLIHLLCFIEGALEVEHEGHPSVADLGG